MNVEIYEAIVKLDENSTLKLNDARGACVFVHWGSVWITQQGDLKDHIVQSGESFPIAGSSNAILTSLSDAGVSVMSRCDSVGGKHRAGNAAGDNQPAEAALEVRESHGQNVPAGAAGLDGTVPDYQDIDRHVAYARQLRARAFADALHRVWAALRPGHDAAAGEIVVHDSFPGFAEIDRHVECAHRLRARAFANALDRGWDALRRMTGPLRELA